MAMSIDLVTHNILFATLSLAVDCMPEVQFVASKEVLHLDITSIPPLKCAHFLVQWTFIFCECRQPDCKVEEPHTCVSALHYSEARGQYFVIFIIDMFDWW
jgi:hypothetical protein